MRFTPPPVYTPPVSYKQEYFTKFASHEFNPRDEMKENLHYALKIANMLFKKENYTAAKFYYEEAIKLGGNERMIRLQIASCDRIMNYYNNYKRIVL